MWDKKSIQNGGTIIYVELQWFTAFSPTFVDLLIFKVIRSCLINKVVQLLLLLISFFAIFLCFARRRIISVHRYRRKQKQKKEKTVRKWWRYIINTEKYFRNTRVESFLN